jgi:hypothetical protein
MDETTKNLTSASSLLENEYVKELFSILKDNDRDASGLSALIGHVSEMENFVKRAEVKIADMKSQLNEMKEIQNHPVKTALQRAIKSLESTVAVMKERINELKDAIIDGAKNAVAAFKEKGISALDKLASFFHIKSIIKSFDKSAAETAKLCDISVTRINEFSNQYHDAGRAIKNMARMLIGKDATTAKKEAGRLAKTLAAPFKAEKALMIKLSKLANRAADNLEQLNGRASLAKANGHRAREKQPETLLGEVREAQQLAEQKKREMPVPERTKALGAEV